jgi:hypothetical protein
VAIDIAEFITLPEKQLLFNAETRHGRSVDRARGKGVRCVAKPRAAIESGLDAASVGAKFNGVKVNTSSILGCHFARAGSQSIVIRNPASRKNSVRDSS